MRLRIPAFAALLLLLAHPATAQLRQVTPPAGQPVLIADPRTGCKLWNLEPGPTDAITWSGPCINGLAEGHGIVVWTVDGKLYLTFEGDYRAGKENGHGVSRWVSGNRFEGEFRNGTPNGPGTAVLGGQTYSGNWTNGCFSDGKRRASAHVSAATCGF